MKNYFEFNLILFQLILFFLHFLRLVLSRVVEIKSVGHEEQVQALKSRLSLNEDAAAREVTDKSLV